VACKSREGNGRNGPATASRQVQHELGLLEATNQTADVVENGGQFRPHVLEGAMDASVCINGIIGKNSNLVVAHGAIIPTVTGSDRHEPSLAFRLR